MKKKICMLVTILMIIPCFVFADNTSVSQIGESLVEDLGFETLSEEIDTSAIYQITGYTNIKELFMDLLQGNFNLSIKDLFSNIITICKEHFTKYLSLTINILAISIIYSLINNAGSTYLKNNVEKITFCAVYISLITLIINAVFDSVSSSVSVINNLISFIKNFTPMFFLILSTTGGIMTSSVIYPVMLFYTSMINSVIGNFIIPLSSSGYVLTLYSKIITTVDFSYFVKFIKKFAYFILGASFTLFGIIVTFEGIAFSSIDSASANTIKYTVSSLVPVIGKFIADSADVINGFLGIIKSSFGFFGAICVITIMLVPTLKLLTMYFCVKICAVVLRPFAEPRISQALDDTAQHLFFIFSCIVFTAMMLIVMIGLILIFANNILRYG